jgi:hypothetical protein
MRQHKAIDMKRHRATLVVASLVTMVLSGCGKSLPTGPTTENEPVVTKAAPSPNVTAPTWNWYALASQWVNKGEAATVSGGRFKVQFVRGGLGQGATVVIMERDPSVTDVVVGPSGTVLSKAATLTIDYAGSAVALSPDFLKLYRLNESTGAWVAVAGTNDLATKMFTAKVSVLGRYALSITDPTKAGW